ncbi:MAG TPA: RDD family protein [Pirellulaceae bacterium]|nr:RDD family protein [Pirellulaceae bacterium]
MSNKKTHRVFHSTASLERLLGTDTLDNKAPVATPENIAFRYDVAGPFTRFLAWMIDMLLMGLVILLASILLIMVSSTIGAFVGDLGMVAVGLFLAFLFFFWWFYGTVLETWWNGRTLGKWILGLRVLTVDGRPINVVQAATRNLLRLADLFPYFLTIVPTMAVGLVVMSSNRRFRRLGDMVAGTMVIIERRKYHRSIEQFQDPRVAQLAEYLPPSFIVSNELVGALSMYVQRREDFSVERGREIAASLAVPLLEKFGLPSDTSYDLLLCALYYRTFLLNEQKKEIQWVVPNQPAENMAFYSGAGVLR